MLDRKQLIFRAAQRLVDEALTKCREQIQTSRRQLASQGLLQSGSALISAKETAETSFREACISVMDKIQREDRENALDLAGEASQKILTPLRQQVLHVYLDAVGAGRPRSTSGVFVPPFDPKRHQTEQDMTKSLASIQENVIEEFQLAVTRQMPPSRERVHHSSYVDRQRIEELRSITSIEHDFSRLIALCEELNIVWLYGANHAVAMLMRSVLDHVPPVFGCATFKEVANNYGSKSFK